MFSWMYVEHILMNSVICVFVSSVWEILCQGAMISKSVQSYVSVCPNFDFYLLYWGCRKLQATRQGYFSLVCEILVGFMFFVSADELQANLYSFLMQTFGSGWQVFKLLGKALWVLICCSLFYFCRRNGGKVWSACVWIALTSSRRHCLLYNKRYKVIVMQFTYSLDLQGMQ